MAKGLHVKGLSVKVDDQKILHDVNMRIPPGEVHVLLGPNGGGKTSLMLTIMGYPRYRIVAGRIYFGERDITDLGLSERAQLGIGIVHQRPPTISGVTLGRVLDYAAEERPHQSAEVSRWIGEAGMESFIDRDINAGLSGGEIKRSEVLQLLAMRPDFVLLDEPDSGVDLESVELVSEMINNLLAYDAEHPAKRRSGLIITHAGHILDHIHVDRAHVMLEGTIGCTGNPRIVLDKIRECGYQECVRCVAEGVARG